MIFSVGKNNGIPCGRSSLKFRENGTLLRIKEQLEYALYQVNGELSLGLPNYIN